MQACGVSRGFQEKFVQKFVQSVWAGATLICRKEYGPDDLVFQSLTKGGAPIRTPTFLSGTSNPTGRKLRNWMGELAACCADIVVCDLDQDRNARLVCQFKCGRGGRRIEAGVIGASIDRS